MRRSFARMLTVVQSGVNIKRVIVFVIEGQAAEKFYLVSGYAFCDQRAHRFKVWFLLQTQSLAGVLLEGALAASGRCHPDLAGLIDKIQQHLFVITAQTNYMLR